MEVVLNPKSIDSHFAFFCDSDDYANHYKKSFLENHWLREGKINLKTVRDPFIKGIGALQTLSGNEVKNLPSFRTFGGNGNISYAFGALERGRWHESMASHAIPMKLIPNWKVQVDPKLCDEFSISKSTCSPLICIYSYGIVSYQIRFSIEFKNAIDSKKLISLLKSISSRKILLTKNTRKGISELVKNFHEIILSNFIHGKPLDEDNNFAPPTNIITILKTSKIVRPSVHKAALAGIISLETNYGKLSSSFTQDRMRWVYPGRYEHQFFLFYPSTTIIYPHVKSVNPKFTNYVAKCIRLNFSYVVEFATLQSLFIHTWKRFARTTLSDSSGLRKKSLIPILKSLDKARWLDLEPDDWGFQGGHDYFGQMVADGLDLQKRREKSALMFDQLKTKVGHVTKSGGNGLIVPEETYERILRIIQDTGRSYEQHPSTYRGRSETDLRDLILTNLQTNTDAAVLAETFNKKGKTDIIIIRRNIVSFIAECKIWKGNEEYQDAIDQLLGYMTYRESMVAVILFVKNKSARSAIDSVKKLTKKHRNYISFVDEKDGNWFNFIFKNESGEDVKLAVLVFHFPK